MKISIIIVIVILLISVGMQYQIIQKQAYVQNTIETKLGEYQTYSRLSSILKFSLPKEISSFVDHYSTQKKNGNLYVICIPSDVCESCLMLLYSDFKSKEVDVNNIVFVSPLINGQKNKKRENENIALGFKNYEYLDGDNFSFQTGGLITIFKIDTTTKKIKYMHYDTPFQSILNDLLRD